MMRLRMLALVLCVTSWVSPSLALPLHKDQRFTQARAKLIASKWTPVALHLRHEPELEGVEKQLAKRGFMEFDSCSIDSSRCILYYRKASDCLRLDTIGEQVNDMTVVQWSNECPPKPDR